MKKELLDRGRRFNSKIGHYNTTPYLCIPLTQDIVVEYHREVLNKSYRVISNVLSALSLCMSLYH
jgi:hypothetical protein